MVDVAVPYADLRPDVVLDAIDGLGFECDGAILALASYENRVYQVRTASGFVVAKFYRPGRWSDDAILEEHAFSRELLDAEFPVVAPLLLADETLHHHAGYRFAVFERHGGRWPELATREDRLQFGRAVGRLHAQGEVRAFVHRPALSIDAFGYQSVETLMAHDFIPAHLVASYTSITADLLAAVDDIVVALGDVRTLRIHGDCHRGNVLWTEDGPWFVDFDDCMSGPAIQDLWLFLAGTRDEMAGQIADLLEGYTQFHDFDYRELRLIEALRTLRLMHYAAWLARRWDDPAFRQAFPWFGENKYWEEHVLSLREQQAALEEPPLSVR